MHQVYSATVDRQLLVKAAYDQGRFQDDSHFQKFVRRRFRETSPRVCNEADDRHAGKLDHEGKGGFQVRQKPRLAWAPFLCNLNIVFLLLFKAHDRITTALVMLEKFECFDELFQRKNAINAGLHRTG